MPATPDVPPPRRFRRRLVAVMLLAGLLPLGLLTWAGGTALRQLLSLSAAPVEEVLEGAHAALARAGAPEAAGVREAQLYVAQAELARRALARRLPWVALGVAAAAGVLLALAAWVLARTLTRRVEALTAGMAAYARGELDVQLPAPALPRDELGYLLVAFNRMGRELAQQRERLRTAEQIAAWQDVARALAHELKNPLTAMQLSLARLTREPGGPGDADAAAREARTREALALLRDEVERLQRMAGSFSAFARLPTPRLEPLALRPLLAEVCALYGAQGPVPVELAGGADDARVRADPDALRRLVGNLVKNALEASRPGDAPVRVRVVRDAERVRVEVEDAGVGIGSPRDGAALTRGLFSTKPGGSGLGLPIAQKIAHEHGGELRLVPAEGRGTRALLDLPAAPAA